LATRIATFLPLSVSAMGDAPPSDSGSGSYG
jgi:hypothetical protein